MLRQTILLIALLIVGCEDGMQTEKSQSESLIGTWAGIIKLDTNSWDDSDLPDSTIYFNISIDDSNMVNMKGYSCDGYNCTIMEGGDEHNVKMITIEHNDSTFLVFYYDDEIPHYNLEYGFVYDLDGNSLTIFPSLYFNTEFTLNKCGTTDSNIYCYFGCTDESNINFDATAIYNDGSCKYGVTGKVVDSQGQPIKDVAILLTYDFGILNTSTLTSSVSFGLPVDGDVYMWVESICGDTINILLDNFLSAGYHSIVWDGNDLAGNIVLDGHYIIHLSAGEMFNSQQNIYFGQSDYTNLENIEGHNYHALSDDNGFFSIPLACLPFGMDYIAADEYGNVSNTDKIPYKVKLWVIHDDFPTISSEWQSVNPNIDLYVELQIP